jgi:SAM-dependent methyltransferase
LVPGAALAGPLWSKPAATIMAHNLYDRSFFLGQEAGSRLSAKRLLPIVLAMLSPRSIVDMGCGVGTWLAVAMEEGILDAVGVDGAYVDRDLLQFPEARFVARDLAKEIELKRSFDLVMSLEVAEHLPACAADVFVDNLVRHGPVVLFSAAVPCGGGTGHVNEQWPAYWAERFEKRGYVAIDCVRELVWNDQKIEWWYRQNVILYAKREYLISQPKLMAEHERRGGVPMALVHPELFQSVREPQLSLRDIAKNLPGAVKRSIEFRRNQIFGGRTHQPKSRA